MPGQGHYSPFFQHVVLDPVIPSLQVGVASGVCGIVFGGLSGILVSAHPVLFSSVAGIQCFTLGSSFYYSRSALLRARVRGPPTKSQELKYSTAAGAVSGAIGGALRSRSHVIPGSVMMALFGFVGQFGVHTLPNFSTPDGEPRPIFQSLTESRWMPLKALSDEDYSRMLNEKLLKIEAEIAILDEKISGLRSPAEEPLIEQVVQ